MLAQFSKLDIMGQYLSHVSPYGPKPVVDCTGEAGSGLGFRFGATSMQGWRKKQEDTYKCVYNFHDDFSYFAVFDGHGGSEVAQFLKNRLHKDIEGFFKIKKDPELALQMGFMACDASLRDPDAVAELNSIVEAENQALLANIDKNRRTISGFYPDVAGCSKDTADDSSADASRSKNSDQDTQAAESMSVDQEDGNQGNESDDEKNDQDDALKNPLKYLLKDDLAESDSDDEDFDAENEEMSSDDSSPEDTFEVNENLEPGVHSGSTATVLIFDNKYYYCANVGDSRCVLCRGGKAIDLSVDHKPDDPEELRRITATGAVVTDGRINKCLNLSRAFGDFIYKNEALEPAEQCVIVDPSIKTLAMRNVDEFIIIASDGLWNSMTSQEAVDFVCIRLNQEEDLRVIAEELFRLILAPDTNNDGTGCDNMTCIIILLEPLKVRTNVAIAKLIKQRPLPLPFGNCSDSSAIALQLTFKPK